MTRLYIAIAAAVILLLMTAPSAAGDKTDAAQKQSAVDHSREVQRMKEHTRDQERKIRDQAAKDRAKVKQADEKAKQEKAEKAKEERKEEAHENAEQEEGFGHDLDDT